MACPFFRPDFPLEPRLDDARMPLVEAWGGACAAGGAPDPETQRGLCNFGYARGRCASFKRDEQADAVRFSYTRSEDQRPQLVWVLERAWAPAAHGAWSETGDVPEAVRAQAPAFIKSWHSRKCACQQCPTF